MLRNQMVFVGVGQFGNYVCREFEKLGHNVFYINSAKEDLERIGALGLQNTYLIKGSKGCMKDRELAKEYAIDSMTTIINQINSEFSNESIVNFCFSIGGGTGSGITPMLIDVMSQLYPYKTINAVIVIPHELDITIDSNASACLKELEQLYNEGKLNNIHKLDNSNFADNIATVNSIFTSTIERYCEITEEIEEVEDNNDLIIKGSESDSGEFSELLNSTGNIVMLEFDNEDNPDSFAKEFSEALNNCIYAPWIKDCKNLGFYTSKANQNQDIISLLTDEFGIPLKTHTGVIKSGSFIIATGMSWNKNIQLNLGKKALELEKKRNEQIEKQKQELEMETIEEVDIDALQSRLSKVTNNVSKKRTREVPNSRSRQKVSAQDRIKDIMAQYKK